MIRASVIIPTFGQRPAYLWDTVECVQKQRFPESSYEILVVDNSPGSSVRGIVDKANQTKRHPVRYIKENNMGLHFARHAGANAAQGEIIVYVDDDVLMNEDWLDHIAEPFSDHRVGAVGGKIIVKFEGGNVPEWVTQFNLGLFAQLDYGNEKINLKFPRDIYGCNMAVRKSVLREVGGFNPDGIGDKKSIWFRGDGECGLNAKIYQSGNKIAYAPQGRIYHRISAQRLTPQSFYWKFFLNGVQDSFRRIRRLRDQRLLIPSLFLYAFYCFGKSAYKYTESIVKNGQRHPLRARAWYWYGKGQHSLRVLFNNKLREHVLRNDYLGISG
jgi:glycosyltransferase involved in cell wall biosynthesis